LAYLNKQWGTNSWANMDYEITINTAIAYTKGSFINLATIINSGNDKTVSASVTTSSGTKTTIPFTFTNKPSSVNELRLFFLSLGK
jgi:hypothetical protein